MIILGTGGSLTVPGENLTGGQWQWIAISRAFMGDKPVPLPDESTSWLDPLAEANLYHGSAYMAENKTVLFITHRQDSTMITDRVFVIWIRLKDIACYMLQNCI